jgi:hypothetical protein
MKANTTKATQGFYAGRVPAAASEPNLSDWGPISLPRTTATRIGAVLGALCGVLLLGGAFGGDAPLAAIALVGLGAAVTLAACLFADSQ